MDKTDVHFYTMANKDSYIETLWYEKGFDLRCRF